MQALYFVLAAVLLYFLADRILDRIERAAGRRFEYRTLVFFALLFGSTLVAFWIMRLILGAD